MVKWLVLRINDAGDGNYNIEIRGIFSDEYIAIAACEIPEDLIGPLEENKIYTEDTPDWPGSYHPIGS